MTIEYAQATKMSPLVFLGLQHIVTTDKPTVKLSDVIKTISEYYSIPSIFWRIDSGQNPTILKARQILMYICVSRDMYSRRGLAKEIDCDKSLVIYSHRVVSDRREVDKELDMEVEVIENQLFNKKIKV